MFGFYNLTLCFVEQFTRDRLNDDKYTNACAYMKKLTRLFKFKSQTIHSHVTPTLEIVLSCVSEISVKPQLFDDFFL